MRNRSYFAVFAILISSSYMLRCSNTTNGTLPSIQNAMQSDVVEYASAALSQTYDYARDVAVPVVLSKTYDYARALWDDKTLVLLSYLILPNHQARDGRRLLLSAAFIAGHVFEKAYRDIFDYVAARQSSGKDKTDDGQFVEKSGVRAATRGALMLTARVFDLALSGVDTVLMSEMLAQFDMPQHLEILKIAYENWIKLVQSNMTMPLYNAVVPYGNSTGWVLNDYMKASFRLIPDHLLEGFAAGLMTYKAAEIATNFLPERARIIKEMMKKFFYYLLPAAYWAARYAPTESILAFKTGLFTEIAVVGILPLLWHRAFPGAQAAHA